MTHVKPVLYHEMFRGAIIRWKLHPPFSHLLCDTQRPLAIPARFALLLIGIANPILANHDALDECPKKCQQGRIAIVPSVNLPDGLGVELGGGVYGIGKWGFDSSKVAAKEEEFLFERPSVSARLYRDIVDLLLTYPRKLSRATVGV